MTFVCPYCQAQTKTNIATATSDYYGFGRAKCSTCGRHFLFMPMSMRMEDESAWKHFRSEAYIDRVELVFVILAIVGIIIAAILGFAIIK